LKGETEETFSRCTINWRKERGREIDGGGTVV